MIMFTMSHRDDDEEEAEDEDAAIGDDALDEIGDDFAEDAPLPAELDPLLAADDGDEEDDEEDVDFDSHDDIDHI
jgi:hypothetical protein